MKFERCKTAGPKPVLISGQALRKGVGIEEGVYRLANTPTTPNRYVKIRNVVVIRVNLIDNEVTRGAPAATDMFIKTDEELIMDIKPVGNVHDI